MAAITERGAHALALIVALMLGGCAPVERAEPPSPRVVVLAPAIAEMLEALGLSASVVGVGRVGPWPATMREAEVVGDFNRPNVERILELGATHLLSTRSAAALDAHERLAELGVEVLALETGSYESVFDAIASIGAQFAVDARATELIAEIRDELAAIERWSQPLPRRSVLLVVGREPLFVAGPGSHLDALAAIAGGDNLFDDLDRSYAQVSLEAALDRKPEVIIDASGGGAAAEAAWRRFEFLPAVRDRRVFVVDPASVSIPGVELAAIARRLAGWLHPEAEPPS